MIGWHFTNREEKLRFDDNREIILGETHEVDPPIQVCRQGLHASEDVLDALVYAPSPILYRVELSGQIIVGDNKAVATHRTYLDRLDCTSLLNQFARSCALSVAHLWDPADDVIHFLLGDESKRAAARDAMAAARDAMAAARDAMAAMDAARYAAMYAVMDPPMYAVRYAAMSAVRYAAMYALDARYARYAWDAWDAARAEQSEVLTEYILEAMGK